MTRQQGARRGRVPASHRSRTPVKVRLSPGQGETPGAAAVVANLIRDLAKGSPPDHWAHDIAYNYLVDQGTVCNLGIQAFPYLITVLKKSALDRMTLESLVHLCSEIFPATRRRDADRKALLSRIGELLQPDREWADKVHLLSAYVRVAAADDFLADSLASLLGQTCPYCGETVLSDFQSTRP